MSNVPKLSEFDKTGLNDIVALIQKLSKSKKPFGCELKFDGSKFTTQTKLGNLKADDINFDESELA